MFQTDTQRAPKYAFFSKHYSNSHRFQDTNEDKKDSLCTAKYVNKSAKLFTSDLISYQQNLSIKSETRKSLLFNFQ